MRRPSQLETHHRLPTVLAPLATAMPIPERILIVDDSEDDNFFHCRAISKAGFNCRVDVCLDGSEALAYLSAEGDGADRDPSGSPDLILLDLNMPRMNGWEFLEAYDQLDPKLRSAPVIVMLTTQLVPEDRERTESSASVRGFVDKPLTPQTIQDLVDELLPPSKEAT